MNQPKPTAIRTLIVDDEPLARRRVRGLLAEDPEIEIIGECGNGAGALLQIEQSHPDLMFLDIQMPDLDGFQVLSRSKRVPLVIFVTAHDQYALRAFRVHAVDYLLKPFDERQFNDALDHAKGQLRRNRIEATGRVQGVLEQFDHDGLLRRVMLKVDNRHVLLKLSDIERVEAYGDYIFVHAASRKYLVRETMSSIQARLDSEDFLRVHRSHIINVNYVAALHSRNSGEYVVTMRDGSQVCASRGNRDKVQSFLRAQNGRHAIR